MPEDFDKCTRSGGRVRRKTLKGGKYINVCWDKEGSHAGHVKKAGGRRTRPRGR